MGWVLRLAIIASRRAFNVVVAVVVVVQWTQWWLQWWGRQWWRDWWSRGAVAGVATVATAAIVAVAVPPLTSWLSLPLWSPAAAVVAVAAAAGRWCRRCRPLVVTVVV